MKAFLKISLLLVLLSSCTVTTFLGNRPYDFAVEGRNYVVFDCWLAQEDPEYYFLDLRYVNDSVQNEIIGVSKRYHYPGDTVQILFNCLNPNHMSKLTPRFRNAYNALTKAYFNNTLKYSECSACAVGNIVAEANGIEVCRSNSPYSLMFHWRKNGKRADTSAVWTRNIKFGTGIYESNCPESEAMLKSTGYSGETMAVVEQIFFKHHCKDPSVALFEILKFLGYMDDIHLEDNPFLKDSLVSAQAELEEICT